MSKTRQELGSWGEDIAAEYLLEQGYTLIARNVRTPYGEIDLVVQQFSNTADHAPVTVFVEVKTRTSQAYGYPEQAITPKKQNHIISASQHYLQEHPDIIEDWRIDVIAIERYSDQPPIIHHFENAIQ